MKTIGFDIDGTLTFWEGGSWIIRIIPNFFLNLLIFSFPRKKIIKKLKSLKKEGNKIVLISNRPERLRTVTILWLWRWGVSYDELSLLGYSRFSDRLITKSECIKEKEIEIFYDNSQKIINYLKTNLGINAKLV